MRLVRRFLHRVIRRGNLQVKPAAGPVFSVGDGSGDAIEVEIIDLAAERQLLLNPALALGELYMDGRLVVNRGSIYGLLDLAASNLAWQPPPGFARAREYVRMALRPLHQSNTKRRAARNVAHHYDLDAHLYELFLDADRQYSCAYFERSAQPLEEAQAAKKRHIAAKLLLEEGHRVLDIGCGWGGLSIYLADKCKVHVTGITLSQEQLGVAQKRAQHEGVSALTDFRLQDYRAVSEEFDRIVSVGMFEHVGIGHFETYFRKAGTLLTDDGVMLLHSIGRMDGPGTANPWIQKYIFPGGYAPALSEVLSAIEQSGLVVTDIEILRLHYAETLKAWRERFSVHREAARQIYDERFCLMWEFYLASCEAAFRYSGLMVFQIQLAKKQDVVPLTRDYIAAREAQLSAADIRENSFMVAAE